MGCSPGEKSAGGKDPRFSQGLHLTEGAPKLPSVCHSAGAVVVLADT